MIRLGLLGVGWIGRNRMEGMLATGAIEAAAVCDPSPECLDSALEAAPGATAVPSLEAILDLDLDGLVIATPSAQHAAQSIAALERGLAVFCQKPLGRDAKEARAVVDAARRADALLGLDLSYRHTAAVQAIAEHLGSLGHIYAADLTFHNAYGPDKPWFYDREKSGGGCVIDLGVHLVDLSLWLLGFPQVRGASSKLYAEGRLLRPPGEEVEDHALVRLDLDGGRTVRLACSWNLHAGQEAVIEAAFFGTEGSVGFRNVGGSFFDFEAELNRGTARERLTSPPDEWGGRAAAAWARRLATDRSFDPAAEEFVAVAEVLDRIYEAAPTER